MRRRQQQHQPEPKRFLLAMLISGTLLFGWQYFFMPPMPPPQEADGQTAAQKADSAEKSDSEKQEAAPKPLPDAPKPAQNIEFRADNLVRDDVTLTMSNRGGKMQGVKILKPAQYQDAGDLLGEAPRETTKFPFGVNFLKDTLVVPTDALWEVDEAASTKKGNDYSAISYKYIDPAGRFQINKTYKVAEKPYQFDLSVTYRNISGDHWANQPVFDITGYKDPNLETSFLDPRPDLVEALCKTQNEMEREMYGSVESPITYGEAADPVKWAGIDRRYFLFAAVPLDGAARCQLERVDDNFLQTRIIHDEISLRSGESKTIEYAVYVGPKDQDVLDQAGHDLVEAIDYGFFAFLARPMRWLLVLLFGFTGNWGIAIILLTILVRLAMWPINHKVYVNSERMKDIQPQIKEIQEKYKNDQQRLSEETMKVFKENNVSMLGCAPMFLQFPIFLALYFMILNSVELYKADFFLWYTDLSASDPYFVLPILMGIVMFAQQSLMTVEAPNPQMKTVMKIMPIGFTAFMLFLPSGVVLYYFASMLIGILQQIMIKKQFQRKREAKG